MDTALEVKEISKTFWKTESAKEAKGKRRLLRRKRLLRKAVDRVSFLVRRGEIVGLLGPNGSGKSTLVRMLCTLLTPDTGWARIFGHDVVKDAAAVRRLVNRVSVEASFFKQLSALENLRYTARLYGMDPEYAWQATKQILQDLGFPSDRMRESMTSLSRGMQQKVAVARGLLTSPVLMLLDEPTTGLDPRSKQEVQAFVREMRKRNDVTVLLCTHDLVEAETLCDRILIMDQGRVVAEGTAEELRQPYAMTGVSPTLEEIFLKVTGREWQAEEEEENA